MTSENNFINLEGEDLEAQRSMRELVKRDSLILFSIYTIGLILIFVLILIKQPPLFLILSLLLVYYVSFKLISNWRGWVALRAFNIHCPHCQQPLYTEKMNIFKSSSGICPHCGKVALAPKNQLK